MGARDTGDILVAPGRAPGTAGAGRYRDDIEGLRAVAVLLVALGHAAVPHLAGGFVGVDVFFVISGFLITGLLVAEAEQHGRPSLLRFYARRVRRILPLAALVTVVVVVASYQLVGGVVGNRTAVDAGWTSVFLANVHFAHEGIDYFNRGGFDSPLEHFWSLGVEEQFYVVWPLLIIGVSLLARSGRARRSLLTGVLVVIFVVSLALSIHQTATAPTTAYFSPLTRAHELGLGALLAVGLHARPDLLPARLGSPAVVVGLAGIVAAAVLFDAGTVFPGYRVLLPTLGAALVILGGAAGAGGGVTRLLGSAPLRYVGQRSYGFYLWHLPFLVLPQIRAGEELRPALRALLLVAAFLTASVTYRLVEDPIRHSRWLRRRPALVSIGVGVALVALVLGSAQASRAVNRVDVAAAPEVDYAAPPQAKGFAALPDGAQVVAAVAAATALERAPADLDPPADAVGELGSPQRSEATCDRTYDADRADPCVLVPGSADRVVLFGDSHMGMWAPGLMSVAQQTGDSLYMLSKYGCPPLLGVDSWHPSENRPYDECGAYIDSALPVIRDLHPSTIIISGAFRDWSPAPDGSPLPVDDPANDAYWEPGLTATIDALAGTGARIVVLGDIGYQEQDASVCLSTHTDDLAACTTSFAEGVFADHNASEQATAEAAGASYVATVPWVCTDRSCPPVVAGRVVFRDASHLTRQYSRWLARAVGTATGLL